jgi:hypothetical protein
MKIRKALKKRRVIKHKLRTLIARLQLELNKVKQKQNAYGPNK